MRKSIAVRLCGWAAVALWAFMVVTATQAEAYRGHWGFALLLLVLFGLGCLAFVAWLVGSAFHWALARQGKQQAAILRDAISARESPAAVQSATGALPREPGAAVNPALACDVCRRAGAGWFCKVHGAPLCVGCVAAHDSTACEYVPAVRMVVAHQASCCECAVAGGAWGAPRR